MFVKPLVHRNQQLARRWSAIKWSLNFMSGCRKARCLVTLPFTLFRQSANDLGLS